MIRKNHDMTMISCAGCFSMGVMNGKVTTIESCPKCGCKDPALLRIRYWWNGEMDKTVTLLKTK